MSGVAYDNNAESITVLSQTYFVKYGIIAALIVVVYDYLLTLRDEISLVWPSRWSYTKLLFLLNRYLSFVDIVLATDTSIRVFTDHENCVTEFQIARGLYVVGLCMAEILIGIRTYAIWNCDKQIGWILIIAYCGFFAGGIIFLHGTLQTRTSVDVIFEQHGLCLASTSDGKSWPAYLFLMLAEMTVIILTWVRQWNTTSELSSPLSRVLFRDGMLFYLTMLGMSAANLTLMIAGPPALSSMMQMPMKAVHSALCSRMLLNIREASLMSEHTTSFSTISVQFAAASHLAFEDVELQRRYEHESQTEGTSDSTAMSDV